MEKLIISKELAYDVKYWKSSVALGVENLIKSHKNELVSFMYNYNFDTLYQVAGYLIGGQDKVYEVKKEPWSIVWLSGIKKFYAFEGNKLDEPISAYEVAIRVYDTEKEARKYTERLNRILDAY